ncbi:hypothetical protein ACS5PM_07420 [Ideonella sp. YS5]
MNLAQGPSPGEELYVEPALMQTVSRVEPDLLQMLARTAAGTPAAGVSASAEAALSRVMEGALRHIEANCTDPAAVRRARESLAKSIAVELVPTPSGGYLSRAADGDPVDPGDRLSRLKEGEHLLVRVSQEVGDEAHALAISATRLPGRQVQLSIFNSHGWGHLSDGLGLAVGLTTRHPAIGKVMQLEDAGRAMGFLNNRVVNFSDRTEQEDGAWRAPGAGLPLWVWLQTFGPDGVDLEPTGPQMTPQKSADCGIEVQFAWLASVLPEADYKLAKAHVLNTLAHAPASDDVGEGALQRLRERVTSSLSGHAMATATAS